VLLGKASQRSYTLNVSTDDLQLNLLDFLLKNQFPIASSCSGEGICKKCVINEDILSCEVKVYEWLEKNQPIEISYL